MSSLDFKELVVIITPPLTYFSLDSLKTLLSESVLNINALGFVADSRSVTLTSEERSFFNFIKSSFGEVSNHHLMTFFTFCDCSRNFPILEEMKRQAIKSTRNFHFVNSEIDLQKRLDIIETSFLKQDLKEVDLVLKALKDVPQLSLKGTKIAQKKYFLESYAISLNKRLKEELKRLISLDDLLDDVGDLKLNSHNDVIEENIQSIWMLAKLIYAMKESQCSEEGLLRFVYQFLIDFSSDLSYLTKLHQKWFLILIFRCKDRNITTSFIAALDLYYDFLSAFFPDLESTKNAVPLQEKVLHFLKTIPGSNMLNGQEENMVQCNHELSQCSGDNHDELSNLQDFISYFHSSIKFVLNNLEAILDEMPFDLDKDLCRTILSIIYPKFKEILACKWRSNNFHKILEKCNSKTTNV